MRRQAGKNGVAARVASWRSARVHRRPLVVTRARRRLRPTAGNSAKTHHSSLFTQLQASSSGFLWIVGGGRPPQRIAPKKSGFRCGALWCFLSARPKRASERARAGRRSARTAGPARPPPARKWSVDTSPQRARTCGDSAVWKSRKNRPARHLASGGPDRILGVQKVTCQGNLAFSQRFDPFP